MKQTYSDVDICKLKANLIDALHKSCVIDKSKVYFEEPIFFKEWYRINGTSYFFLFKKNLNETNIQFSELLSLLKKYIYFENSVNGAKERHLKIHFHSSKDFKQIFTSMAEEFIDYSKNDSGTIDELKSEIINILTEKYYLYFISTVLFDAYHGSALVFLPPHLSVKLKEVVGLSGYIHSCGYSIFARRISKSTKNDFLDSLKDYFSINQDYKTKPFNQLPFCIERAEDKLEDKQTFLSVYCHEDFDFFDKLRMDYLRNGLNDTKIYIDKYYMGEDHLIDVIQSIRNDAELNKKVYIPLSANYKTQRRIYKEDNEVKSTFQHTLFLIVDKEIGNENNSNNADKFYILYDQIYVNKNQIHILGENKPAWIDHTTLPPTLSAAMMNLAVNGFHDEEQIVIADPFLGSGTTLFESFKYGKLDDGQFKIRVFGGDLDEYQCSAILDNIYFFIYDLQNNGDTFYSTFVILLEQIRKHAKINYDDDGDMIFEVATIHTIIDQLIKIHLQNNQENINPLFEILPEFFEVIIHVYNGLSNKSKTENILESIVKFDSKENYETNFPAFKKRIFMYFLIRVIKRHNVEIARVINSAKVNSEQHSSGIGKLFETFLKIILNSLRIEIKKIDTPLIEHNKLSRVIQNEEKTGRNILKNFEDKLELLLVKDNETFSEFITLNLKIVSEFFDSVKCDPGFRNTFFKNHDLLELNNDFFDRPFDVLLTDPPYGFNTNENIASLIKLYAITIDKTLEMFAREKKESGQIIMCLPDISYTGRKRYYFTSPEFVGIQIKILADKHGLEIVPLNITQLFPNHLFRPPYFWNSEKALRRTIIHYKFRIKE